MAKNNKNEKSQNDMAKKGRNQSKDHGPAQGPRRGRVSNNRRRNNHSGFQGADAALSQLTTAVCDGTGSPGQIRFDSSTSNSGNSSATEHTESSAAFSVDLHERDTQDQTAAGTSPDNQGSGSGSGQRQDSESGARDEPDMPDQKRRKQRDSEGRRHSKDE